MGNQNFGGDIIILSGPHEPKLDGNEDSLLCLIKLICILNNTYNAYNDLA